MRWAVTCAAQAQHAVTFDGGAGNPGRQLRAPLTSRASPTGAPVEPARELREATQLKDNGVLVLFKKAYSLCDAPKEWFVGITSKMTNAGWAPMELEPCL